MLPPADRERRPGTSLLHLQQASCWSPARSGIRARAPTTNEHNPVTEPLRQRRRRRGPPNRHFETPHVIEDGEIAGAVRNLVPEGVDRVLDLVGNSVLRDSLRAVRTSGRICQAGFLGGLGPIDAFLPMLDMPSAVQFSFFGSFELGTDAFPLSAIPLQHIVEKVEAGDYQARPSRVLAFEDVAEAHSLMERNEAAGKLVVAGA